MRLTHLITLTIIAASMLAGCSSLQREQAGQAADALAAVAAEIDDRREQPIGDIATIIMTQLDVMTENGLLDPAAHAAATTALEAAMAELDATMPSPELIDALLLEIHRAIAALEAIATAPTEADAVASAITGATAIAAPLAGPYAPWVTLAGAAAASIITGLFGQQRGRTQAVRATAMPIDDARLIDVEAELATKHPGRRFLVVDKDKVAKGHLRSGVAPAIERATTAQAI